MPALRTEQREIERLQRKVEDLEYRLAEVLGEGVLKRPIPKMTAAQFRCIEMLARRSPMAVTYDALLAAASDRFWELECPRNNLSVHMTRARKHLTKHGLVIETIRTVGYRMPPESKAKWQALVESVNGKQEAAA
tara:strand:+ start:133 stop:537 length:405 start_codon:yes stop_codon:yes gene_type:complete